MKMHFETEKTTDVQIDQSTLNKIKNELEEEACTIVHCTYVSKSKYVNGGWVNINLNTVLSKSDRAANHLPLLHAINVPMAPERHQFTKAGETMKFTLFFAALPKDWTIFNLVEMSQFGDGFSVTNIARNSTGVYRILLG